MADSEIWFVKEITFLIRGEGGIMDGAPSGRASPRSVYPMLETQPKHPNSLFPESIERERATVKYRGEK